MCYYLEQKLQVVFGLNIFGNMFNKVSINLKYIYGTVIGIYRYIFCYFNTEMSHIVLKTQIYRSAFLPSTRAATNDYFHYR